MIGPPLRMGDVAEYGASHEPLHARLLVDAGQSVRTVGCKDGFGEVGYDMAGRPSKYDPAFCELVVKCGEEGDTLAAMAEACDVDRATINDWIEQHEEFSRAVKRGLQKAQAWWEKQGRIATFGGKEGFNATSFIFNMKNRFKEDWRDKVDHGHENPDGTPITFTTIYERKPNAD